MRTRGAEESALPGRVPVSRTHRVRERVETMTLAAAAVVVILFSLADLLGLLDNVPSVKAQAPIITLAVLGVVLAYLVLERRGSLEHIDARIGTTLEHLETLEARLLRPELIGVEVFGTTEEMMRRITAVTIGCSRVNTLNLSPPMGVSAPLDSYFREVGQYLRSGSPTLQSFRVISSLESVEKARWVLTRAADLVATGKVSSAVIPMSILPPEAVTDVLFGFHIVYRAGLTYVFFYHHNMHIDPTAVTDCFLLKNSAVGEIMTDYFERLWRLAVPLHVGTRVETPGLTEIGKVDTSIVQDPAYAALRAVARIT